MTDEYLTMSEVASRLKVSVHTVRGWARSAYLPTIKVGRQRRISTESFRDWLEGKQMSGGDYRSDWPTLRYDDKDYKVGPAKPKETKLEAPNPDVPPLVTETTLWLRKLLVQSIQME